MHWTSRHPVLIWTLTWGSVGLSVKQAGVFDRAAGGALWVPFVVGTIMWSLAGATTVPNFGVEATPRRLWLGVAVWGGAFVWLASVAVPFGEWIRQTAIGSVYLPAFVGMAAAWASAAALAAAVTIRLVKPEPGLVRPVAIGFRWGFSFFFGGYLGVPLASILGQTTDVLAGSTLGHELAFGVGWTGACLLAGLMASTAAFSIGRGHDARRDRRSTDRPAAASARPTA